MKLKLLKPSPCGTGLAGTDLTRRQFWSVTVLFAALLAACYWHFDRLITDRLPHLPANVVYFYKQITVLGLGGIYMVPALILAAYYHWRSKKARLLCDKLRERTHMAASLFVFSALAVSGIFTNIVKVFIGRPRPYLYQSDEHFYFQFDMFPDSALWKSFPSGHTNTIFAFALAIGFFRPRWRMPLLLLACIVGASRVYIGAHYPSDVLGGAFIAYLTTYILRHWWEREFRLPFRRSIRQ